MKLGQSSVAHAVSLQVVDARTVEQKHIARRLINRIGQPTFVLHGKTRTQRLFVAAIEQQ